MQKIPQKARAISFPLKAYQVDIQSAFQRATGDQWQEQFVKPEFLSPRVRQSFEVSFILLMKALSNNNQQHLQGLLEPTRLLPKLQENLDLLHQQCDVEYNDIQQNQLTKLSQILLYETLVTKYYDRGLAPSAEGSHNFKAFSLLSSSSLKRRLMIDRKNIMGSLLGMRRIVRVHCQFDTNLKIRIVNKKNQELMFGSKDLNGERFEKRNIVFECQDFQYSKQPFVWPKDILLDEQFKNIIEQTAKPKQTPVEDKEEADKRREMSIPHIKLNKKHQKQIKSKRSELEHTNQEEGQVLDWSFIENELLGNGHQQLDNISKKSWRIADIDYWLDGNLPYPK